MASIYKQTLNKVRKEVFPTGGFDINNDIFDQPQVDTSKGIDLTKQLPQIQLKTQDAPIKLAPIPGIKPEDTADTTSIAKSGSKGIGSIGKPGIFTAANIATGVSSIANTLLSLKGISDTSKSQPNIIASAPKLDAVTIKDDSSSIASVAKDNISRSVNTARHSARAQGVYDPSILAKETTALNELSGKLAEHRLGIDAQNAQIQNNVNAQNAQMALNVDAQNVQTINQFNAMKSEGLSKSISSMMNGVNDGLNSIFNNSFKAAGMKTAELTNNITAIKNEINNLTPGSPESILKKEELDKKLQQALEDYKTHTQTTYK